MDKTYQILIPSPTFDPVLNLVGESTGDAVAEGVVVASVGFDVLVVGFVEDAETNAEVVLVPIKELVETDTKLEEFANELVLESCEVTTALVRLK